MTDAKAAVQEFWEQASCGEDLLLPAEDREGYREQSRARYELEPEILEFAEFERWRGKKVLEIGVGLGADHQKWAEAGAVLSGVDLTARAIAHTKRRFELFGLQSDLRQGDAENLPFETGSFDVVYSWGVLMASPDTPAAIREVHRVLRPGGTAKIMLYHTYSFVGYMLWVRYALLRLRPWLSLRTIYDRYLESPGMKAYSVDEARELFGAAGFADVRVETMLCHGDLLTSGAGQRHRGTLLTIARKLWPRTLIKRLLPRHGLFMTIEARKA